MINFEYVNINVSKQSWNVKVLGQKGNSPDHLLRPINYFILEGFIFFGQLRGTLGISDPLKKS